MQESQDVEIWPCNVQFVEFFAGLGPGAWNVGMNGRTGLRYEALPFQFDMAGIPKKKWPTYYDALRVMETAALEAMYPAD